MINCEKDLLTHLIVLTPRNARKEFRKQIFKEWNWRCAYCDKKLNEITATIDHIVPKFKGGHNIKSNMCCSCSNCNKLKGSTLLDNWYTVDYPYYCKERLVKIKKWMEQSTCSLQILSIDKAVS